MSMLTDIDCGRRVQLERRRVHSVMPFVCFLDGSDVMTAAEYSQWRDRLRDQEDGG